MKHEIYDVDGEVSGPAKIDGDKYLKQQLKIQNIFIIEEIKQDNISLRFDYRDTIIFIVSMLISGFLTIGILATLY